MPPETLAAGSSELLPPIRREAPEPTRAVRPAPAVLVEAFRGKRLLDLIGASLAVLLLFPIMLAAAMAIGIESPGPVLFRQRRSGLERRPFTILKFRTMRVDDGADVAQARRGDPRVTRVGALLRRSSLDELPQLLNVLAGEMSLVGPRPHALCHDEHYRAQLGHYALRHLVRPGMTGWAQVNRLRGETADSRLMAARVDADLWYIGHRSFWLDLKILGRTAVEVMRFDAY